MFPLHRFPRIFASVAMALSLTVNASAELTTNGDFETGDTSGWLSFPSSASTFEVTADANSGSWGGIIANTAAPSAAVIKQANLGVGVVTPGEMLSISFWAKGSGVNGGVAFAEFFSEKAGGGISKGEILGGGPLSLDPNTYQRFTFSPTLGPDVSGGVTLQFAATTGANIGSTSTLFIDNVSVTRLTAIPEPGSAALLGLFGVGLMVRRRRC